MRSARYLEGILAVSAAVSMCESARKALAAEGKSDLRIVSSFVASGEPVPERCRDEIRIFGEVLSRYPQPSPWHWVMVCDQAGWRRFLRLSRQADDASIDASTDLETRTTYLWGDKLLNPNGFGEGADDIVSHELAHILLGNGDEQSVEKQARWWRKQPRSQIAIIPGERRGDRGQMISGNE